MTNSARFLHLMFLLFTLLFSSESAAQVAKPSFSMAKGLERFKQGPSPEQVVDVDRFLKGLPLVFQQIDRRSGNAACTLVIKMINLRGGLDDLPPSDALFTQFDQQCLGGVDSVSDDLKKAGIEKIVGVVYIDNKARCTGFRVSRDVAMTAKHCFFSAKNGQPAPGTTSATSFQLIEAGSTQSPTNVITCLDRAPCPAVPPFAITASADFIYLKLLSPQPEMPSLRLAADQADSATPLILLGYWGSAGAASAREAIRWSKGAQCFAPILRQHCIYHTCQAVNGFSGGAIFLQSATAGLQVAGLHLAGAGAGYYDCPGEVTAKEGNIGLRLSSTQWPNNP